MYLAFPDIQPRPVQRLPEHIPMGCCNDDFGSELFYAAQRRDIVVTLSL